MKSFIAFNMNGQHVKWYLNLNLAFLVFIDFTSVKPCRL